jgi:signal transduction histidine kinase
VSPGTLFKLGVSVPMIAILLVNLALNPDSVLHSDVLFWTLAVAVTELLPIPARGGVQLSLSFPLLLGAMILYLPLTAATVALVGTFDRKELNRTLPLPSALFNRAQIALSVLFGGVVFHLLASPHEVVGPVVQPLPVPSLLVLVPSLVLATCIAYLTNVSLVTLALRTSGQMTIPGALSALRVGALREFLLNYLGLSLIGIVIVELYDKTPWTVVAFIAPLVFARQMFFRTMALEEATDELKDRERVLRALSNRMAEERQDERLRIAAYLHDDLAQTLFQLTLRLEMAKKRLSQGDIDAVSRDLDQIAEIKQRTGEMVRSLVRDLHHAPIGRAGLTDALESMLAEMTQGTPVRTKVEVVNVPLPPPIQLLIYQIAREAVMNSMKHADPRNLTIALWKTGDGVDLIVADDGKGFDTTQPQPDGHFGSVMMRERAIVTGGSFKVESEPGRGTTITAHFPEVWVQEGNAGGWEAPDGNERATRQPDDARPNGTSTATDGTAGGEPFTGGARPQQQEPPRSSRRSASA